MKNKKFLLSVIYLVLLSLFVAAAILLSKPADKGNFNHNDALTEQKDKNEVFNYKKEVLREENINILNNKPELSLNVNLTENMSGQVTMNISYKKGNAVMKEEINTDKIPEIRNLFRFRDKFKQGYTIKNILVNYEVRKLYFFISGKQDKKFLQTWLYSYDLESCRVDKVFFDTGDFGKLNLSPEGKYNAFAYENITKGTKASGRNRVVVVCCENNRVVLNGNRDINGKIIGPDQDLYIYGYDFVKWQDSENCILKQTSEIKDGSGKIKVENVSYNVVRNEIVMH